MRLPVMILALVAAGPSGAQQSGGVIEGQVVDALTSAPVRKALVTLSRRIPSPKQWEPFRAEADLSGKFAYWNLPSGSYRLEAGATGYIAGDLTTGLQMKAGSAFALADGQTLTGVTIRLTPASGISGRIVDEDGDPLPDFHLILFQPIYLSGHKQFSGLASANTDDRGRYRITGIPAGKYYLAVTPSVRHVDLVNKAGSYQHTFYPGVRDFSSARAIVVAPGSEAENTNLKLSRIPTVRVRGQVIGVTSGTVTLIPGSVTPYFTDIQEDIRNDGRFEIKGIPPGDFNLVVRPPASSVAGQWVRHPLTIGTSDVEGVTIAVPPPARIDGRAVVESDSQVNLTDVYVRIDAEYPNTRMYANGSAQLAGDGTFHIADLAPDRYRVRATPSPTGLYLKAVRIGRRELPGQILELGASADIEVVLSGKTAIVTGVVHLAGSGQPARGAAVILIPQESQRREDDSAYFTTVTDDAGNFTVRNIPPGEYRAFSWEARPRASDYMDPDFVRPFDRQGVSLTLGESGRASIELTAIRTP